MDLKKTASIAATAMVMFIPMFNLVDYRVADYPGYGPYGYK